jgi:hypothetical protein
MSFDVHVAAVFYWLGPDPPWAEGLGHRATPLHPWFDLWWRVCLTDWMVRIPLGSVEDNEGLWQLAAEAVAANGGTNLDGSLRERPVGAFHNWMVP